MKICGFVPTTLLDYPGHIACVVFLPSCNYDCYYCHNRELIERGDFIESKHTVKSDTALYDFLIEREGFIDGVVISGGEPTLFERLKELCLSIKKLGVKVKIDTNGSNPDVIKELIDSDAIDYVALDYKAPSKMYEFICGEGADFNKVLKTMQILRESDITWEVRTTVVPELNFDSLYNMCIETGIKFPKFVIKNYRKPILYRPFHEDMINKQPYSDEWLKTCVDMLRPLQPAITFSK